MIIFTKYHGPTNRKGARISAKCQLGGVIVGYPHHLMRDRRYIFAASELCKKYNIKGRLVSAEYKSGMVFITDPAYTGNDLVLADAGNDCVLRGEGAER